MRSRILFLVVVAGLFAIGLTACSSSNQPSQSASIAPPQNAVVVTGQGGATTIFLASSDPDNPIMLCTTGDPVCPECRAAAIKYFKTGVLDPKCSRTGATRTLATQVDISHIAHN